jgi:hypothetical protein
MTKYDFSKLCQEIEQEYEKEKKNMIKQKINQVYGVTADKGFTKEEQTLSDIIDLAQSILDTSLSLVHNRICLADKAKIIDYANRTIRLALTIKHEK